MRLAAPCLLLLAAAAAAAARPHRPDSANQTVTLDNSTRAYYLNDENRTIAVDESGQILLDSVKDANDTFIEYDGEHEPIVRKKRTFGDIVFRGLADVLGYQVARKPAQVVFPPPVAPVPGIDAPLLVLPAGSAIALPLATQAAPAAPAAPPCGTGRAAPPPCRPPKPPPPAPKAAPPCPRPRAAPKPKPKPRPPPPPPPCPQPRANPTTPSPCAPAPPKQTAPPAKDDPNLERITSNFQLNFNFNREPVNQAAAEQADDQQEVQEEQADEQEQFAPIPIQPQAARLPAEQPRKPRVYVDAFVVNNGVPQRVDTVDAKRLVPQRGAAADDEDDHFLAYDDDDAQQDVNDYDVQETRDQDNTIREFGNVIDRFWEKKKMMKRTMKVPKNVPLTHYQDVHFGDRDLSDEIRLRGESHQSLQRANPRPNRIPVPIPEDDDDEATTTTEDPRNPLKPRVLPPTEQNPNQIDTITVRVPPIYKEKRPRKLHRDNYYPERDDEDEGATSYGGSSREEDAEGYDSIYAPITERPVKRKRRRKYRRTRSVDDKEEYKTDDEFDYFGRKIPITNEEKYFMGLTVPPPTRDADVLRHEKPVQSGYFLEDHERLRDDPSQRLRDDPSERLRDDPSERVSDDREKGDSSERSDDKERLKEDPERAGDEGRADSDERSDQLSPNARVTESNYENKFVRATNVQVEDPQPRPAPPARHKPNPGKA